MKQIPYLDMSRIRIARVQGRHRLRGYSVLFTKNGWCIFPIASGINGRILRRCCPGPRTGDSTRLRTHRTTGNGISMTRRASRTTSPQTKTRRIWYVDWKGACAGVFKTRYSVVSVSCFESQCIWNVSCRLDDFGCMGRWFVGCASGLGRNRVLNNRSGEGVVYGVGKGTGSCWGEK